MSKLNQITLYWNGENYCCYNDSDAATYYINGYRLNTRETIKQINEDGADKIVVDVVNNDSEIPIQKRLNKISKECGYNIVDKSYMNKSPATGQEWFIYEFHLTKQ